MGNGREHLGTVLDEVLQLRLHGIEGKDCLADLRRPDRLDGRGTKVDPETSCALGKLLQRPGQMARGYQRNQGGRQQHQHNQDQIALPLPQAPTARRNAEHQPGAICQLHQQGVVTVLLWPVLGLIGLQASFRAVEQALRQRGGRALHSIGDLGQIQAFAAGMPADMQAAVSGGRRQALALRGLGGLYQLGGQGDLLQKPDLAQRRVGPDPCQLGKQGIECQRREHRDNGGQGNPACDGVARAQPPT